MAIPQQLTRQFTAPTGNLNRYGFSTPEQFFGSYQPDQFLPDEPVPLPQVPQNPFPFLPNQNQNPNADFGHEGGRNDGADPRGGLSQGAALSGVGGGLAAGVAPSSTGVAPTGSSFSLSKAVDAVSGPGVVTNALFGRKIGPQEIGASLGTGLGSMVPGIGGFVASNVLGNIGRGLGFLGETSDAFGFDKAPFTQDKTVPGFSLSKVFDPRNSLDFSTSSLLDTIGLPARPIDSAVNAITGLVDSFSNATTRPGFTAAQQDVSSPEYIGNILSGIGTAADGFQGGPTGTGFASVGDLAEAIGKSNFFSREVPDNRDAKSKRDDARGGGGRGGGGRDGGFSGGNSPSGRSAGFGGGISGGLDGGRGAGRGFN